MHGSMNIATFYIRNFHTTFYNRGNFHPLAHFVVGFLKRSSEYLHVFETIVKSMSLQESVCDIPWEVMNNNAMQTILETKDTNVLRILWGFRRNNKQV